MNETNESVHCVILPQFNSNLLLPRSNIVAILQGEELDIVVDLQAGIIGKVRWRGLAIPLISFEAACHSEMAKFNSETKTVILHSLSDDEGQPYIALTLQGRAQELELSEEQLSVVGSAEENDMVLNTVQINEDIQADIPDIPMLVSYASQYV